MERGSASRPNQHDHFGNVANLSGNLPIFFMNKSLIERMLFIQQTIKSENLRNAVDKVCSRLSASQLAVVLYVVDE